MNYKLKLVYNIAIKGPKLVKLNSIVQAKHKYPVSVLLYSSYIITIK